MEDDDIEDDDVVLRLTPLGLIGMMMRKKSTPEDICSKLALHAYQDTCDAAPIPALVWVNGAWQFAAVTKDTEVTS